MDSQEIAARLAIQERANRYTDAILRADRESYADCWTEDGSWHIMGQHLKGRAQITNFYLSLTEQTKHVRHLALSPILRIDGDTAQGRWQITETVCMKNGVGSMIIGVYDDAYRCQDGIWRFSERKLDIIYQGPVAFDPDGFVPLAETRHPF